MVIRTDKGFVCEQCSFTYPDELTARRCEEWCGKHKSCNLDIAKERIQ